MPYTAPSVSEFRDRFPGKFVASAVSDAQIAYALGRAARQVDTTWTEGDFQEGQMLYAAAFLTTQGLGALPTGSAEQLAGIKSMKSGALSVEFADNGSTGSGDPALTVQPYGAQFTALLRQNRGGALVTSTGVLPAGYGRAILGHLPEGC